MQIHDFILKWISNLSCIIDQEWKTINYMLLHLQEDSQVPWPYSKDDFFHEYTENWTDADMMVAC